MAPPLFLLFLALAKRWQKTRFNIGFDLADNGKFAPLSAQRKTRKPLKTQENPVDSTSTGFPAIGAGGGTRTHPKRTKTRMNTLFILSRWQNIGNF